MNRSFPGVVARLSICTLLCSLLFSVLVLPFVPVARADATSNGTTWYLRSTSAATAFGTVGPTFESSLAIDLVPGSPLNKTTALAMTDQMGSSQVSVTGTETSLIAGQMWFRTFLSPKLAAQTINSGTTFRFEAGLAENNTGANMTYRLHIYKWREGTGFLGSLLDTITTADCGVEPGAANSERSQVCVTAGTITNVAINNGDQLALEIWVRANNTSATSFTGTMYLEGNGFVGNGTASHVISSAASNLSVSQTLVLQNFSSTISNWFLGSNTASSAFGTIGPMAENSGSADLVSGSPAGKTTALAMTDQVGSSQTSVAGTETSSSAGQIWFRTFLSPKLAAQTIPSGTSFRVESALAENSLSANMTYRLHIYQWRQGTGYVASLIDTVTSTNCGVEPGAANSERSQVCVTAGTASHVTLSDGDQLALEVWVRANNTSATSFTGRLYFGGNTFIENGTASHVVNSAMSRIAVSRSLTLQNTLSVDMVDGSGNSVASPSVAFSSQTFSFNSITSSAILGISTQKIRVSNSNPTVTWTAAIAATAGPTALWSNGGARRYDFNDLAGASDGSDPDTFGGQLTIDPSVGTVAAVLPCVSTTGISKGSSAAFSETTPIVSSITLMSAGSTATSNCSWDLTGVSLQQAIPAAQPGATYTISLTITVA